MPTETGFVVNIKGSRATVKTVRSEACQGCSSKGFCDATGGGSEMEVEATNRIGARVGDQVMIEISTDTFVAMSALVYIVPVIGLLGGVMGGNALGTQLGWDPNLTALLMGFAMLAITLSGVSLVGNLKAEKDPRIVPRIISIKKNIKGIPEEK